MNRPLFNKLVLHSCHPLAPALFSALPSSMFGGSPVNIHIHSLNNKNSHNAIHTTTTASHNDSSNRESVVSGNYEQRASGSPDDQQDCIRQKPVHDVRDMKRPRFKSNNPFNALLLQLPSSQMPYLDPSGSSPFSTAPDPPNMSQLSSSSCSVAQREWEKFLDETMHRCTEVEREPECDEALQYQTIPIIPCRTCGCVSPAQNKPRSSQRFVDLLSVPSFLNPADSSHGSYAPPSLYAPSSTSCSTLHALLHHPHISLLPCWRCLYPIRQPLTTHLSPSRPITCASLRESQGFSVPDFPLQGPFLDHCSCVNRLQVYRR